MDQQLLMKRILVVDDELDSNLTLKLVLEDNGFKVDAFTDPLLALENFKAGLYVMLILDKNMPKSADCVRFTGSDSVLNLDESQEKYAHYLPRTSNS
jgi:CheY-like chemotaxis protein